MWIPALNAASVDDARRLASGYQSMSWTAIAGEEQAAFRAMIQQRLICVNLTKTRGGRREAEYCFAGKVVVEAQASERPGGYAMSEPSTRPTRRGHGANLNEMTGAVPPACEQTT